MLAATGSIAAASQSASSRSRRIVLTVNVRGFGEIWTMDPDGSRRRRLTWNRLPDLSPTWSPDGRRLAIARTLRRSPRRPPRSSIVLVDVVTRIEQVIREGGSPPALVSDLAWSPDGRWIAFTRITFAQGRCRTSIHAVRPDGSGERQLVRDGFAPDWSPNGSRLAFATTRPLSEERASTTARRARRSSSPVPTAPVLGA
ncbi:MAG: hypothetical protein C4306_01365 [Thermoleophilia bacterium]